MTTSQYTALYPSPAGLGFMTTRHRFTLLGGPTLPAQETLVLPHGCRFTLGGVELRGAQLRGVAGSVGLHT